MIVVMSSDSSAHLNPNRSPPPPSSATILVGNTYYQRLVNFLSDHGIEAHFDFHSYTNGVFVNICLSRIGTPCTHFGEESKRPICAAKYIDSHLDGMHLLKFISIPGTEFALEGPLAAAREIMSKLFLEHLGLC
jgi:hypothetical protein